jgi:hypothetical protein
MAGSHIAGSAFHVSEGRRRGSSFTPVPSSMRQGQPGAAAASGSPRTPRSERGVAVDILFAALLLTDSLVHPSTVSPCR